MVVDYQRHWVAPGVIASLAKRRTPPRAHRSDGRLFIEVDEGVHIPAPPHISDLDRQLQLSAEHGIDVVVSSPLFAAQVLHLEATEAAELLEEANKLTAAAQRDHPDRFVGIAFLPLQDAEAALSVLDKAVAEGLTGVSVLASIDGAPIATESTLPIFKRIEELGLPILLHPAWRSNTYKQDLGLSGEIAMGWMWHTSLAALNLIQSGVLDECPKLTVLHPHLGGMLPYVLGRVDAGADRSIPEYLRRHFYTDVVSMTPAALQVAVDAYGLDRMLFATDFPWIPIEKAFEYMQHASAEQRATIFANTLPGLRLPSGLPGESA